MKKQSTLLRGIIIVFTFCIAILAISSGHSTSEYSTGSCSSQDMTDTPGSPIFLLPGSIKDPKQLITTESDLSRRNLFADSSPLISVCLFVRNLLHR